MNSPACHLASSFTSQKNEEELKTPNGAWIHHGAKFPSPTTNIARTKREMGFAGAEAGRRKSLRLGLMVEEKLENLADG